MRNEKKRKLRTLEPATVEKAAEGRTGQILRDKE
jgi:hypothetical protein